MADIVVMVTPMGGLHLRVKRPAIVSSGLVAPSFMRGTIASLKSEAVQLKQWSAAFIGDMQCLAEERGPQPSTRLHSNITGITVMPHTISACTAGSSYATLGQRE